MGCDESGSTSGTLLGDEQIETIRSFIGDATTDCGAILEYIGGFISKGISEGRFSEKQAHHDLGIALWVAYACNNMGDYEHYYTAAEWLSRVEDLAKGHGVWYYRYANALMYCGKPSRALEYSERGVVEDPEYPWTWLTLGRLRSHFGDRRGALEAVNRGLELVPDDYEFITLASDIAAGASIEEMEMHFIDPDSDARLSKDPDDPESVMKRLAVEGIVCDRAALDRLRARIGITGWSADHPYCTFLMDRGRGSVMVTLMMNEAQASKRDPEAIARILESLDTLDSKARGSFGDVRGSENLGLYGVSIGPTLSVKLSYASPGSEEVTTVDFDSDLELIERIRGGPFAAIVLLSSDDWDPEAVISNMRTEWGIQIQGADVGDDCLIGSVGEDLVAVCLIHSRVPGREAEENASNNYLWPEAVEAVSSHTAHLVVALVNHGDDPLDCGLTFTKLLESCARFPNVLGVYHCGTVFQPSAYIDTAQVMRHGDLPLEDMVWFGMYRTTMGINAYTVGMSFYGRDEMEVVGADDSPARVAAFLYDISYHVLYNGTTLRDGDSIGFSEDQVLKVRKGPGVSIDGLTLKIEYPGSDR